MSDTNSPDPCTCGHMQRHHVGGRGRCPVWEDEGGCICPKFTPDDDRGFFTYDDLGRRVIQ